MAPYLILIGGLILDVIIVLAIARVIGYDPDRELRDWEGEE